MTLPELAIRRRVTTLMILVSLTALGAVALDRLPLAFLPDVIQPRLFVRLPYPSASPDQIERMVVRPVEDALGSVKGLRGMWSRCDSRGGMVKLNFRWSANMREAHVEVWEKLDRIRRDLPEDLGDITVSPSWNNRQVEKPVLEGRLSSKRDLSESYALLERKIVRPLQRVPGVAQVRLDGVNPKEVRINLRARDLELHNLDVRQVSSALRASNFDQSLGRITDGERRFSLRTLGSFSSVDDIRNLPLRSDGLKLSDVAEVVYEEPALTYGRHLDGDFAIGITVSQEARANTVEVAEQLEARIEAMKQDPELEGVNFLVWLSQGNEIKKALKDLTFTGIFGALLATVVLFGFLRRFSSTMIAVLCIPLSLIVTCGVVWLNGKSLNTLTLLGLIVGVGMLVDNAVVVMENIFRHQEEGADRKTASYLGAKEVSTAVITATITSVIVFLPLVFNKPSELNIYLKELGVTVGLTLLASLFISQTLIPLATSSPLIGGAPATRGRWMTLLERGYLKVLQLNLRHRWLMPLLGALILASAVYPYQKVDMNFDVTENQPFVQVTYHFSEELSLDEKERLISRVETELMPHKEKLLARSIYSYWSDNFSLTRLYLKEGEANEKNTAKVRKQLRKVLPKIPGLKLEVVDDHRFWRQDRGKRVAFQLSGEDFAVLGRLAEDARLKLETIPGLQDSFSSAAQGPQELHIELDRALMDRYEVAPSAAAQVVGLTYRGRRLRRYSTPQGEREMRLTLDERAVESVAQLRNLSIWTKTNKRVPLAVLGRIRTKRGAETIQRSNRRAGVWVGARYTEGTKKQYVEPVKKMLKELELPFGYTWTFGGWQKRQAEKSKEFLINLGLALLLIFAVMAGLFESLQQSLALMIALPFALAGAAWSLYLTKTDFDQPAAVGVLLLIGIVVNNGIVMIEHINGYRRQGLSREEAMLRGGKERLRPILMTAMTTLIGLLPMVIQRPSLGGIYYYSMALVLVGGLMISTVMTTILLPTTITLIEDLFVLPGRIFKAVSSKWRPRASAAHPEDRPS